MCMKYAEEPYGSVFFYLRRPSKWVHFQTPNTHIRAFLCWSRPPPPWDLSSSALPSSPTPQTWNSLLPWRLLTKVPPGLHNSAVFSRDTWPEVSGIPHLQSCSAGNGEKGGIKSSTYLCISCPVSHYIIIGDMRRTTFLDFKKERKYESTFLKGRPDRYLYW